MQNLNDMSTFRFQAVFDVQKQFAERLETVFSYYADLNYTVQNDLLFKDRSEARQSQRLNLSTNFGPGPEQNGGDRSEKIFFFDQGSTLRTWQRVTDFNRDPFLVINLESLSAILFGDGDNGGVMGTLKEIIREEITNQLKK